MIFMNKLKISRILDGKTDHFLYNLKKIYEYTKTPFIYKLLLILSYSKVK